MKIVWRNGEKPTGPYRSFASWGWPSATAETEEGPMLATLDAEIDGLDYHPAQRETAKLMIRVADHRSRPWKWRTLKKRVVGVREAKRLVKDFFDRNPSWLPDDE